MPRKQAPEEEYDPIKAEVARNATSRGGGGESTLLAPPYRPASRPEVSPDDADEPLPPKVLALAPARSRTSPRREQQDAPQEPERPRRAQQRHSGEANTDGAGLQRRVLFKHFKVTADEDLEILAFVQRLQQKSRSKVTFSIVARALFHLAMHAEDEVMAELTKGPQMARPGNENEAKLAEYEELWIQRLSAALRKSRPLQVGLPRRRPE
ncbi:MAG TPA: hypothetical protein VK550_16135 [Polyangiaceae bacterium]|nr:hypothetical protein [Polyangiaceae bacterium]